jgi:hypothetical protein
VIVESTVYPDHAEFRVTDHTPGLEWPERAQLPPESSERGRGIYLIQTVMAETQYVRGELENVLMMRRARDEAPYASAPRAMSDKQLE